MLKVFLYNERGTETVEWGIMAGLIVAGLVTVVTGIGAWVLAQLQQLPGGGG